LKHEGFVTSGRRGRLLALRRPAPRWAFRLAVAASFALVLGAWWSSSHTGWVSDIFLPTPEAVWAGGREILADGSLWPDIEASFLRVTYGFLLSAVLAIPIGVLVGALHLGEGFVQPLTEFVRYVPVPALTPILMVVFGIDELSKVMLIFVGTYFQLVLMVADEIRRVPHELLDVASTLGARKREVIAQVLVRSALPGIFDALRLCNGWAWTYVIVAELVAANEGLGYRILKFSRFLQTPKIWVYLLVMGGLGLGLDVGFRLLNRRLFRWADTTR